MDTVRGLLLGALTAGALAVPATGVAHAAPAQAPKVPAGIAGLDVSGYQPKISWNAVRQAGARFAYVKATESTTYRNPYYSAQYNGARQAGLIRGAYHFALPHRSGGAAQADYFVQNGGGWTADGWTLPGVLDIEFNPYASSNKLDTCYDLTPRQMTAWIRAFSDRYLALTGRRPAIYTNGYWWQKCTGSSALFTDHPLWIARYSSSLGALPGSWTRHAIWQYADSGVFPGDQNVFNGSYAELQALATGPLPDRAAAAPTRLTAVDATPEPVKRGRRITVRGALSRQKPTWGPAAGLPVTIRFKPRGGKWTTLGTVTTAASGGFRKTFKARVDGSWRAVYAGGTGLAAAKSASDYVDVR